jgi:DNA repair protein RadC
MATRMNPVALQTQYIQRLIGQLPLPEKTVEPSDELVAAIVKIMPDDGKEHAVAVAMNTQGQPIAIGHLATGTVDCVMLPARDVYSWALLQPTVRYVGVAHNHPSGDTTPSGPDAQMTGLLAAAGKMLGVELLWSLVVTHANSTWQAIPVPNQPSMQGDDAEPSRTGQSKPDESQDESTPEDESDESEVPLPVDNSPVDTDELKKKLARIIGRK